MISFKFMFNIVCTVINMLLSNVVIVVVVIVMQR